MCADTITRDSVTSLRGLTSDELSALLISKCALQVRDVFERTAVQTDSGLQFQEAAAAEITVLLFDLIEPMTVSIVALGSGRTEQEVRQMAGTDLLISLLRIMDLTLRTFPGGNIGERLLLSLYSKAAPMAVVANSAETSRH